MERHVYCIIVTYNAMKWVDKCFTSLRDSSIKINPVVVDNLSTDGTVDYIKKHYPEVYIIENRYNKGFGQANNQGIEYAYKQGATHLFLLNQDAWVSNDGVEKMVKIQDENDIAVISPIHLNGKGQKHDFSFLEAVVFEKHNHQYVNDLLFKCPSSFYLIEKVNAAAWMVSRKTIDAIGGFDPLFFHYGEDINYCQRLCYHKKLMAFTPLATICHDRGEHGNMTVYNKRAIISHLLCVHSNINHAVFTTKESILNYTALLWWRIIKTVFCLKWREFSLLVCSYFEYISKLPAIFKSRKQNKVAGHNWLNL